jgi:hypothetical protein
MRKRPAASESIPNPPKSLGAPLDSAADDSIVLRIKEHRQDVINSG